MTVKKKDPAAVALGRRGGKKGGPARAAKLTPEQRSASARKAVQARWANAKQDSDSMVFRRKDVDSKKSIDFRMKDTIEAAPATTGLDASRKALHLCLEQIKAANNENELRRLTEELQKIVFHKQYQNA
ncbi:MAG: hypothetical protein ABSE21_15695 [Bryobacteraceae bacterium]|jgi:hypothetical protein